MGTRSRSGLPGCRLSFWGAALGFDSGPSAPAPYCGTRHSDRQYRSPISVARGAWACGRRRVASPRGSPSLRRGSALPAHRQCWCRGGLGRNLGPAGREVPRLSAFPRRVGDLKLMLPAVCCPLARASGVKFSGVRRSAPAPMVVRRGYTHHPRIARILSQEGERKRGTGCPAYTARADARPAGR